MLGQPDLTTWRRDPDFRADPTPLIVLDRELVIRALNPAYETVTGFGAEQLMSRHVFDAFPGNPEAADEDDGATTMADSWEQVLREGRPHNLVIQRYDIPDAVDPERFVTKTWAPVNLPVWSGDDLVGVACRVEELPLPKGALDVITPLRARLRQAAASDDPDAAKIVEAVTWGLRQYTDALTEIDQLQEALSSRATIDQAKGLLMAEHHCGPDDAFQMLVKLSNDTNVRLADVAGALVYQAQRGDGVG